MKLFILLLILSGFLFSACTVISINDATNLTLVQGSCAQINNTNITIYAEIPQFHINNTLNFNECFNSLNNSLSICAKPFPTINKIYNLSGGQNYTESVYNFTLFSTNSIYNITKEGNFGENLSLNGITLTCPAFPIINEILNIQPGDLKIYDKYRLTVYGPSKLNIKKTFDTNEHFVNDAYGLDFTGTPPINQYIMLNNSGSYFNQKQNLTVAYNISEDQYELMCNNLFNQTPKIWYSENLSTSCESPIVPLCADKLLAHCTVNELFQKNGAYVCMDRLAVDTANQCNSTLAQLSIADSTITGLRDDLKNRKKDSEDWYSNMLNIMFLGMGIILIVFFAIFAFKKYKRDKQYGGAA